MEYNLHKLRSALDRERAKAMPASNGPGPIWQSASAQKGSLRTYANDVRASSSSSRHVSERKSSSSLDTAGSSSSQASPTARKTKKRVLRGNECLSWTKGDILAWLQSIGLGKHKSVFSENEIDGSVLLEIGVDDLDYMGITALAHRKTLLKEVARLKRCVDSESGSRPQSRQLQPLRDGSACDSPSTAYASCDVVEQKAQPGASTGGYQGDILDEEAEHEAFKRAVEEWRNAGKTQKQRSARESKDGFTSDGPMVREVIIQSAREYKTSDDETDRSENSRWGGELDEEAEKRAFQEAVRQWRSAGDSKIDVIDYSSHKQDAQCQREERTKAMLEEYEANLKKKSTGTDQRLGKPQMKKNISFATIDVSGWDFDAAF